MLPLQCHRALIAINVSAVRAFGKNAEARTSTLRPSVTTCASRLSPLALSSQLSSWFGTEPSHRQASRPSPPLRRKITCKLDTHYVGVSMPRSATIPCQAYLRKSVICVRTAARAAISEEWRQVRTMSQHNQILVSPSSCADL